ncbi:septation protein SepH [Corynebacterium sp. MC-17D]|uniref:DUF3071 domain-containing protein n=1 Tax=Corynebacterium lipophilum TaxID=2804918 RepID=A0AAW5HVP3_9CORY|nr:septation protein SepH [Corynebacterium lipophilum]MCO6394259.1 DUF3071 domain-containing protein [Corynebacterium lipophilum]MCZ2116610.1 septation protein SepH [Corynebacterium lipophilum]
MRELYLMDEESTETFFVLRDDEGIRYQLARSEMQAVAEEESTKPEPEVASDAQEPSADADNAHGDEHSEDAAETASEEKPRSLPEPDPLYSTPLSMRPNQIQARIRFGTQPSELAEEMGVAESRIDPYAHPVLLERSQVAEAAKQSHPMREDGPAKLTLFEILATAFAARGHSLSDATWDATREPGDDWVVHVRWQAGLSENEALWSFHRQMGSAPTTEARNSIAADLTDPDFVQPVRSLTAIDQDVDVDEGEDATDAPAASDEDAIATGDFLQHPDEAPQPQKRRRKAVTPHWEDVLLGVRTNTKRPRK